MIQLMKIELNEKDFARQRFRERIRSIRKPAVRPARAHYGEGYRRDKSWKKGLEY
jgi:hypothetical protein